MRKEHILRVFENKLTKRIFKPDRNEVTEDWVKSYNE
jgi:hypothetical protein